MTVEQAIKEIEEMLEDRCLMPFEVSEALDMAIDALKEKQNKEEN